MRARKDLWVASVGLLLAAPSCVSVGARAYAGGIYAQADGALAQQSLSLAAGSSGAGASGARPVDLADELGADDGSIQGWAKVILEPLDLGRVTASAFRYDESGSGMLGSDFGDLSAGTNVRSDLAFNQAKLSYTAPLLDTGVFWIAPGVGVDVFDFDMSVQPVSGGGAAAIDTIEFMPLLYAQAGVDLALASFEVDAGWIDLDTGEFDGSILDVEANLFVNIFPMVELMAGYRHIDIDGGGRDGGRGYDVDFNLDGWFIGGGVSF